ncbi:MAG: hypothetical protein NC318_14125 [Blautia sp.]|nr:hypothetical protein [Lachnoclostridium sp.]MCM1212719.1 hypothetical protein [Blautia sp.]
MKQSEHKNKASVTITNVIRTSAIKTSVIKTDVMLSMIVSLCMILCTACQGAGSSEDAADSALQGDLQDIMADIYAGVDLDAETKEVMQEYYITDTLTADNQQALLGTNSVSYTEGVYSVPMNSSIAYQCVLLRVEEDEVENVKSLLKENADVNKWVCVSAETVLVENRGNVILFIMSDKDVAYAVSESFQAIEN